MREYTSEPMNPGPILIIRNTFRTHLDELLFSASFKSENTNTHLLSCIHLQNPKIPLPHHIYFIALLFTLFALSYFILFIFTSCTWQPLGGVGDTRQWSWFAGCLKTNNESFLGCSPRVRYETPSSLVGKIYSWYNTLHLEYRRVGTFA
jgi:hypothetical protein